MVYELNCTHPLASAAGNVSKSELLSLLQEEERQEFILKIRALIFMIIYVCLGIPGNILVIVVYKFRFRPSTTKTFIMSLSTFDLISCVLGIPFEMVDLRHDVDLDFPALCKILRFIITFCACGSTLILLTVAVDRFRRICQPFKRQMSVWQSKIVLLCMTFLSFFISMPALILYGRQTKLYRGVSLVDCTIDDAWAKTGFANAYQFLLGMLWIFSILVLCVLYGVIIYKIRKQEVRRLNLTSNSMASVNVSRFYVASSSKAIPTSNGNRKGSGASNPRDIDGSPSIRARLQNRNILERSNSNPDERKSPEEGRKGNGTRQPTSINRLFSRDVNPIYEEEDEAHKPSDGRIDEEVDSDEVGFKTSQSDGFVEEEIVEDGDTIILVKTKSQAEMETEPKTRKDSIVLRYLKNGNDNVSKRRSQSVPCLKELSHIYENKDFVESDNNPEHKDRIAESTTLKRSNSLPMSSENEGKHVYFINRDSEVNDLEITQSPPTFTISDTNKNHYRPISEDDNETRIDSLNGQREESINQGGYFERPRNVSENSTNRLEVGGKKTKYASDDRSLDRITSRSDQTNGSILTLNDSKIPHDRQRKISAYSMSRQASFTSNSYSNDRSSKVNSFCSQNSVPARIHKNSVASYTGKMSIASTSTRELKTSKIAVIMFYVTMGHVLSYLPHLAIQFHRVLGPYSLAKLLCNSVYFAFHHLLLRSIYLNNAINPIIYSYNNGQFRQYCAQLLKKPFAFCNRRKSSSGYTIDSAHSLTMD